ncbi:uncharacterized protein [Chironomus tepperi]|uniref:uncharacterized protein n=1 Tax=Chironomus tepperi TaxID=113505 RepID=UPI00391F36C5
MSSTCKGSISPKVLNTYSTFANKESGIVFKIQDIPENQFDNALKMLVDGTKEEPLCASRNVHDNVDTVREFERIWTGILYERLSVGCFNDDGDLVGLNVLMIKTKGEEGLFVSNDRHIRDMMDNMTQIHKKIDLFTNYNIDRYLTSLGLYVNPQYRSRGIAKELLKVRRQIMASLGLTLTVSTFTAIGSQKAAKSVGFEEIYVISYEELRSLGFDFVNKFSDFYKIMALKV